MARLRSAALTGALALAALFARTLPTTAAAAVGPSHQYAPVRSLSLVQDKDFYLLTLIQRLAPLRAAVAADPALKAEAQRRRQALVQAQASCKLEIPCELAAYRWGEAGAAPMADALVSALTRAHVLDTLVEEHMRPSGRFQLYADLGDAEMVRRAWLDAAAAMDRIIRIYGLGEKPLYPLIDSASYPPVGAGGANKNVAKLWKDAIEDMVDVDLDDPDNGALFFDLPLGASLQLLDMNDRNEPARLEPLSEGENAAAYAYARTIDWKAWTYPVMLIPGRSPELPDNPLSPEAKQKMRLAARRFKQGLAPIIVVSGGYVLPSQTRFAEALEMKRELMRTYGVPERAILVDPFARHTTTNLRNTERLLFEIGAPLDRPILVTTTAYQSGYIEGQVFHDRCPRELSYPCFSDLKRLSMFDTVLSLPLVSLQRDARDPLDP